LAEIPFSVSAYQEQLLAWYDRQGRQLPWRGTRDPYRIWLSEIMLQQTTVAAVIGYFERFTAAFATVEQLAAAPLEAVIDLWAGLGYYSRARNLHAAAKMVVEDYGGLFPADLQQLQCLPGVGRSTAGAIAALAFDQRAAILDGNVRRVLCRLFALQEPARSSRAEKQLWHWATELTPQHRAHDYTQAIMDFGATLCVPAKPLCDQCPLAQLCQGQHLGIAGQLPLKQPRKQIPNRAEVVLLAEYDGNFYTRRRLAQGFLGGLWEFPACSCAEDADTDAATRTARQLMQDLGFSGSLRELGEVRHVYSHFRLRSRIYHLNLSQLAAVAERDGEWLPLGQLQELALHGAHKKVLQIMVQNGV